MCNEIEEKTLLGQWLPVGLCEFGRFDFSLCMMFATHPVCIGSEINNA